MGEVHTMTKSCIAKSILTVVLLIIPSAAGFSISPLCTTKVESTTALGFFGNALKDAFGNDDLGDRQNAGLSKGPNKNEQVTVNGRKVNAIVGQPVSAALSQARARVSYSCKVGDCGTCTIKINGRQ